MTQDVYCLDERGMCIMRRVGGRGWCELFSCACVNVDVCTHLVQEIETISVACDLRYIVGKYRNREIINRHYSNMSCDVVLFFVVP